MENEFIFPVPDNIGNININIIDVIKRLQEYNIIIFNIKEYNLINIKVIKKLIDVKYEDNPDINNVNIIYIIDDDDNDIYDVDNGGYNVQPVPPPNSIIIDKIKNKNDNINIYIEKLFILG